MAFAVRGECEPFARGRGDGRQVLAAAVRERCDKAVRVRDGGKQAFFVEAAHGAVGPGDRVGVEVEGNGVGIVRRAEILCDLAGFDTAKREVVACGAGEAALAVGGEAQNAAVTALVGERTVRALGNGLVEIERPAAAEHGIEIRTARVVGAADGELPAVVGDGGVLGVQVEVAGVQVHRLEAEFAVQAAAHEHGIYQRFVQIGEVAGGIRRGGFGVADEERVVLDEHAIHNAVVAHERIKIDAVVFGHLWQGVEGFHLVDKERIACDGFARRAVLRGRGGEGVNGVVGKIRERNKCLPVRELAAVLVRARRKQPFKRGAVWVQVLIVQRRAAGIAPGRIVEAV